MNTKLTGCTYCGGKNLTEELVDYVYRKKDQFMLVNNVPCYECVDCGEKYYEGAVLEKIENDFRAVHSNKKPPHHTIQVPVEKYEELMA